MREEIPGSLRRPFSLAKDSFLHHKRKSVVRESFVWPNTIPDAHINIRGKCKCHPRGASALVTRKTNGYLNTRENEAP